MLPSECGTSSARCPMANLGSVPIPTNPPSSRIAFLCPPRSSCRVVHCWPSRPTYCRASSQTGQSSRGPSYWTPHVTQIGSDTLPSCHGEPVSRQFIEANSILLAFQALLVALTGAGIPPWLERLRSRGWALILPVSIAGVVAGIALFPQLADALTWIALILPPPGGVRPPSGALRGARPPLGVIPAA